MNKKQDWLITIPKKIRWEDYEKELETVKDGSQTMWYKVSNRSHIKPNIVIGDRMFVLWNGYIRGWMKITGVEYKDKGFVCSTTGQVWAPGWYIGRSGEFHSINPIPKLGFQGYRRIQLTDDLIQYEISKALESE